MLDIVMQPPERFSTTVRAALEAELPTLHPAVIRSRFHFRETGPASELVATLDRIGQRRQSQGVIRGPHGPEVTAAGGRRPRRARHAPPDQGRPGWGRSCGGAVRRHPRWTRPGPYAR